MALLLKNAHIVDPSVNLDGVADVAIEGDRITAVGENLAVEGAEVIDLSGKYLVPGLVDMHVHLRDPGYEHKGDIVSETRAAAKGGMTGVCSMPNTDPVTDNGVAVEYVKSVAAAKGHCRVYPSGAITKGLKGEIISEMGDMVAHGCVAFTDDGRGIQGAGMLRRAMDYGKMFGKVFMSHCQDEDLVGEGQINEGAVSTRLGLLGWPAEGEELQIQRDIMIARLTGAKLHIQHISTARGLEMVRAAKAEGLPVTCEATPHHLFLTEDAIDETYNTSLKVNPPLRTAADAEALREGVADGTVDAIVTDHAPHADWEKSREFELAPFGMIGIEGSLALVLTNLVKTGKITYQRMVELMSIAPRRILGVDEVKIEAGSLADITVFDPEIRWTIGEDGFESRAHNCGFTGTEVCGRATDVFVGGKATLRDGVVC
ncbi:dihydroorotase [Collinsella ihumii]|uniref:Dihydroorotase n=1 Tax=Collinsella ihumii TaxID=1720204 RepID=A0A921IST2_9ACTN|nr:dihydroorotase [Collinsella ihumii]MBM6688292.1 dihydroorotase [Collinsella tanakaei]MBM6905820.1 dihydroorotase [Collinsella tanakaei]MDN0064473.1 dihydroorotase [Collinsella ihumii]HJG31342.1 dihydroorotase [Collinsella ihumii]